MTVKKNKTYDEYLLSNQQFLNRVYTVIFPVSIQIIQKENFRLRQQEVQNYLIHYFYVCQQKNYL